MKRQLRNKIINKIIETNVLHSLVAKYAVKHKKENQFLIECYEQAHVLAFQRFLGEELFNDLIKYNVQYNNKQKINFMNSTLTKQKTKQ